MRLWHKDLIPYLPKKQLQGQWRELNSIYKLQNKHILINFIYEYDFGHLLAYNNLIIYEMGKRGYKINLTNADNFFLPLIKKCGGFKIPFYENLFENKMNNRYLKQCLYNLEEKAVCGGMKKEEWNKIYNKFNLDFDLWRWE